jgi:hypothetical protein
MNSVMGEYKSILEKLANNDFPSSIDEKSFPSISVFKELYARGLIQAHDTSTDDGDSFLTPKITFSGRQYLSGLNSTNVIEPTEINNTINFHGSFSGTLQSGVNNTAKSVSTGKSNWKNIFFWVMKSVSTVVIPGVILAIILNFLELK